VTWNADMVSTLTDWQFGTDSIINTSR